jgi:hypothetical protein
VAYTRLPGKKGFFHKFTLWLAEDHILAVESNYYTEIYKRFYFKDFQALIVRKTDSLSLITGIIAAIMCVFLIILLAGIARHNRGLTIFASVFLLSLTIKLAVHLIRGTTCACHLKMPLAVHELPSLCRMKYARLVLEQLTPLVQKFQGTMSVDEIRSRIHERASVPSPVRAPQVDIAPPDRQLEEYSGFVHTLMFGAVLVNAGANLTRFYSNPHVAHAINLIASSALLILVVAALVKQSGRSLPGMVKGLTWTVLAFETLTTFVLIVVAAVSAASQKIQTNKPDWLLVILNNPGGHPVLAKTMIYCVVGSVILGISGLAAIMTHRLRAGKKAAAAAGGPVGESTGV